MNQMAMVKDYFVNNSISSIEDINISKIDGISSSLTRKWRIVKAEGFFEMFENKKTSQDKSLTLVNGFNFLFDELGLSLENAYYMVNLKVGL